MTNKDALEALDTLSSIAHLNLHGSVETTQFDCIDTIRQALEVNQELVVALKEAVRLWDEHKATHEYHITSWKQAIAKAEGKND